MDARHAKTRITCQDAMTASILLKIIMTECFAWKEIAIAIGDSDRLDKPVSAD